MAGADAPIGAAGIEAPDREGAGREGDGLVGPRGGRVVPGPFAFAEQVGGQRAIEARRKVRPHDQRHGCVVAQEEFHARAQLGVWRAPIPHVRGLLVRGDGQAGEFQRGARQGGEGSNRSPKAETKVHGVMFESDCSGGEPPRNARERERGDPCSRKTSEI